MQALLKTATMRMIHTRLNCLAGENFTKGIFHHPLQQYVAEFPHLR